MLLRRRSSTLPAYFVGNGRSRVGARLRVVQTAVASKLSFLVVMFCADELFSQFRQCARRQLKCGYPKDSRRGQRKRSQRKLHDDGLANLFCFHCT
jgi:hypothetical protein